MKKFKLIIALAAFIAAGYAFNACDKNDFENPGKALGKKGGTVETDNLISTAATVESDQADCADVCIDISLDEPVYYPKIYQDIVTHGGSDNKKFTKIIDLKVYNTATHFVIEVKSDEGWSDLVINEVSSWPNGPVAANVWGKYSVALPEGWEACDDYDFELKVAGNGPQAVFDVTYKLIGICIGCEESFSYVDNEDGTYTFTYVPAESIAGAALVFTFPQDALNGALTGWIYNGQTMQTTMDLVACTTYEWTVSLTCKDLNNPQNKWTDFKVNGVSKKGVLNNIDC